VADAGGYSRLQAGRKYSPVQLLMLNLVSGGDWIRWQQLASSTNEERFNDKKTTRTSIVLA